MKKYIELSLLFLIAPILLFGQEEPAGRLLKPFPPGSGAVETFANAFADPNVFIGVFEYSPKSSLTTLSTGDILENIPGYGEACNRFSLSELRCTKPIKGRFVEPVTFISTIIPPIFEARPMLPGFCPHYGSKWVLALEKTSQEYRIYRFGKDIEKYKFLNDHTMFEVLWYGYGALCLTWPEKKEEPPYLVKVPESIVNDLEAIQRVVPYAQKEKRDPNEMAALTNTSKALKTDVAKSIFAKVLSGKYIKAQDPNDK
jgi:hypothetical protein